jgi:hypothetical protein
MRWTSPPEVGAMLLDAGDATGAGDIRADLELARAAYDALRHALLRSERKSR